MEESKVKSGAKLLGITEDRYYKDPKYKSKLEDFYKEEGYSHGFLIGGDVVYNSKTVALMTAKYNTSGKEVRIIDPSKGAPQVVVMTADEMDDLVAKWQAFKDTIEKDFDERDKEAHEKLGLDN